VQQVETTLLHFCLCCLKTLVSIIMH